MTDHSPTTLMTGATGFMGHFVLRELLTRGRRVAAIVRPPLNESRARLRASIAKIGTDIEPFLSSGQLVLVEGALPGAMPEPAWGRTDDILSCAASLKIRANGDGEPARTNVEG